MTRHRNSCGISRRHFLQGVSASAVAAALTASPAKGMVTQRTFNLRAAPTSVTFHNGAVNPTPAWAYGNQVPGPEIRAQQGDRLRIWVENALDEETTVHWHGVRVPNDMDGVPGLTQEPIVPGSRHLYEFVVPDAGTFWYHSHHRGFEQVGRGLYGPLVVDERHPIQVDRDVTWVLDDWRLLPDGSISEDFGNFMDLSHGGRMGNTVTVNGRAMDKFAVRAGERIRLRLINAANARIFGLAFEGHHPLIVAIDGQPVEPHPLPGDRAVLGPAMRLDLILDMTGQPRSRHAVTDDFYRRQTYRLTEIVYDHVALRENVLDTPIELPANPVPEPDLISASRHEITFGGGMMGRMTSAMSGGMRLSPREMMHRRLAWTVNGVAAAGESPEAVLTLPRDTTHVLSMHNDTAWPHPIHLHGHSFRVISRNGRPTRYREWQDTVLMMPSERAEIALVADNPGDWLFHCHILEHAAGGMTATIRVT